METHAWRAKPLGFSRVRQVLGYDQGAPQGPRKIRRPVTCGFFEPSLAVRGPKTVWAEFQCNMGCWERKLWRPQGSQSLVSKCGATAQPKQLTVRYPWIKTSMNTLVSFPTELPRNCSRCCVVEVAATGATQAISRWTTSGGGDVATCPGFLCALWRRLL